MSVRALVVSSAVAVAAMGVIWLVMNAVNSTQKSNGCERGDGCVEVLVRPLTPSQIAAAQQDTSGGGERTATPPLVLEEVSAGEGRVWVRPSPVPLREFKPILKRVRADVMRASDLLELQVDTVAIPLF